MWWWKANKSDVTRDGRNENDPAVERCCIDLNCAAHQTTTV